MTASATGLVGRFTVRSASKEGAARFGELDGDALGRASIERGAYLVIRRVAVGAASAQERDTAIADEVTGAARSASRPRRGHLPHDASSVLFADLAEMTATLLLEIARGVAVNHWWWRYLEVDVPARVANALLRNVIPAPAALDCLDTWGVTGEVLSAMTDDEAKGVADALRQAHVQPSIGPTAGVSMLTSRPSGGGDAARGAATDWPIAPGPGSLGGSELAQVRRIIAATRSTPRIHTRPAAGGPTTASAGSPDPGADRTDRRVGYSINHPDDPPAPAASTIPDADVGARPNALRRPNDRHRTITRRSTDQPSPSPEPIHLDDRPASDEPMGRRPAPTPPAPLDTTPLAQAGIAQPLQASTTPVGVRGFRSQWAGAFYLVGALRAVEPPEPHPWGHERWALLAAIAHQLADRTPDPIWEFFHDLAAHPDSGDPFPPALLVQQASVALDQIDRTFEFDDGELAALVATPGVVQATSTHIDIQIDLSQISMVARVRGLDADPGWCPELGRVIRFHFESER